MNGAKLAALYKPPTLFERAKAITRKYSGSLFVASDAYCYSDSSGTTPATQDGVVGYWKDLTGSNHATQGTTANKPILRKGAKNWLLNTATLSTQNVTTIARSYTLSFTGTGSVTLTGTSTAGPLAGTGANDRVSLTFTPTAGTLTLTVAGSVTNAMLEFGSTFTGYGASGATSASNGSGNWWLDFDGSNDNLSMATYFSPSATADQGVIICGSQFASSSYRALFSGNCNNGSDYFLQMPRLLNGTAQGEVNTSAGTSTITGSALTVGTPFVLNQYKLSAVNYLRTNAVADGSNATGAAAITADTTPKIGCYKGTNHFFSGPIYGLTFFAGAPATGEMYLLERYLGGLGGLSL